MVGGTLTFCLINIPRRIVGTFWTIDTPLLTHSYTEQNLKLMKETKLEMVTKYQIGSPDKRGVPILQLAGN